MRKIKILWIGLEDLHPPRRWTLPFIAEYQGVKYKITGIDYVDRVWKAEEVEGEI